MNWPTEFTQFPAPAEPYGADGPLGWPGYAAQRERAAKATGESESVTCGRARIGGHDVVLFRSRPADLLELGAVDGIATC